MSAGRMILVTGWPGTGKTTLARTLATRYRVPLLAKDAIKEPLLDALPPAEAAHSRQLSDISFAVLFAVARELNAAGCDGVLEGNFRPGEHEQALRSSIPVWGNADAATFCCQVLCRVDEAERVARLTRRHSDPARHPGHRDSDLASAAPPARGDSFLDLPGEQFVHAGDPAVVIALLDEWWYSRTVPPKSPPR